MNDMSSGQPRDADSPSSNRWLKNLSSPRFAHWGLVYYVLPFVGAAVAAKLFVDLVGWDTIEVSPLLTGVVAADVFLLGFLLAGTLADFKESERLPSDLAASLETLSDECEILYRDKRAPEAVRALKRLRSLAADIHAWLRGDRGVEAPLQRIKGLNADFLAFEPLTQPNFIVRLKQEQAALRRMVLRINTVRETSFVGAGYAVAEVTSVLLVIGLLFFRIPPLGAELFLVGLIAFLLTYVIVLIKDLDDPFECVYEAQGAAEVSLEPLAHLEERLDAAHGALLRAIPPSAGSASPRDQ